MSQRVLLIGIDEAGYGPILGPLVVSAAAFEINAAHCTDSLWAVLRGSVSSTVSARGARIPILDSKKLHKPKEGVARLERSVLAAVTAWRGLPPRLHGLLNLVCPDALAMLKDYPWYAGADPALPLKADAGAVRVAAAGLRRDMDSQGVSPAGCWSEVLPEGHYNRLVGATRNKSVVLMGLTLRLVQRVAEAYPDRPLHFFVDKQGARERYGGILLRNFQDRRLRIVEETAEHSDYELVGGPSAWRVSFHLGGESCHLPIALASMLSKYVREALMACFNEYWAGYAPALRPTAGYYEDGLRFLRDIEPHRERLGIARDLLVRQR